MPSAQVFRFGPWFPWPLCMIGCVLFFVLMIVTVAFIMPRMMNMMGGMCGGMSHRMDDKDPLQILKQRYARGEISEEDFERMKKNLQE